uniref:Uncharacterized protein LOC114329459 n=1 Tax=Diabrotica virgifera virgifera TaxID=50390 RepID=A0A6P7FMX2_DIAVI
MEMETDSSLPFLDVLIKKNQSQGFHHSVYRKPTHTNRYLHGNSHHPPSQINSVINTLVSRSIRLSDDASRSTELSSLKQVLIQNGYHENHINRSIYKLQSPAQSQPKESDPDHTKGFLPYIKVSALGQHILHTGHKIDFDHSRTIAPIRFYKQRIIREAIEIEKRPNCLNKRDDGIRLPSTWRPLLKKTSSAPIPAVKNLRANPNPAPNSLRANTLSATSSTATSVTSFHGINNRPSANNNSSPVSSEVVSSE